MLLADENVFKSIYDNFSNDVTYGQFAEKHHIVNYVALNKKTDSIDRCIYLKRQERLYNMFKAVSSIINDVAIQNDINIAFVKGIFLEKKYYDANCWRKVSDIDLIVAWDDIYRLLMGCQKVGLFCNYTEGYIKKICSQNHYHDHHIELQTEYVYCGTIFSFKVEFHFKFFSQKIHENYVSHEEFVSLVLENRDHIRIDDYDFPILNLKNDTLFVLAHAVKHLIWDFHRSCCSSENYYISLSNFYDVHLMFDVCIEQGIMEDVIHSAKKLNILEELLLCMYIENVFFNSKTFTIPCLDMWASFINPKTRWVAFFAYYIIKNKVSNVLLGPISGIGKTLLCFANQDNRLDEYMKHGAINTNNDPFQLQICYSSMHSIIISLKQLSLKKIKIFILKNLEKTGVYKTYNIDTNNGNNDLVGEINSEVTGDRITIELTSNAIAECVYNQKVYLRVSLESDEIQIPMQYNEQTKFTFFCVELENDEKNIQIHSKKQSMHCF